MAIQSNYSLNKNQYRMLVLLYKFRFVTIPLLKEYLELKYESTTRKTLQTLESQGYIARIFNRSFIKISKPAYYYLDKKGIALLKESPKLDSNTLHSYYKNKNLSEETRDHALSVMATYNHLKTQYNNSYHIFTKGELGNFDNFPEHKPDLYLRKIDGDSEYFVTLAHDVQPFFTRKRLAEYIEHSEEEGWSTGKYPALLFVLKNSSHEFQFLDHAMKMLENAGIDNDELRIGVTTIKAINQTPIIDKIWTFVGDDTLKSLT